MVLTAVIVFIGVSLPTRGAWIEIQSAPTLAALNGSLPTRGAWIEMIFDGKDVKSIAVAPHTGSVD